MKIFDLITKSEKETQELGASLAKKIASDASLPKYIAFCGDLGVGKTVFIRGFITALSPEANIKSPTYSIVHEYHGGATAIYHFDMYRITDDDDLYSIGYYEYIEKDAFCLVEWSENIEYALPDTYIRVTISKTSVDTPDERAIIAETI